MKISCYIIVFLAAMAHFGLLTILVAEATCVGFDLECAGCQIIDITHPMQNGMASFGSQSGAGEFLDEHLGEYTLTGTIKFSTHLGTHVDSASHIFEEQFRKGVNAASLDLKTLTGPVLVVQTPPNTNITANVLRALNIPKGTKRVIFKTPNTDRRLMDQKAFAPDYIAFTKDGAEELASNTDIKFVGIDYMSVGTNAEIVPVHQALLGAPRGIIPVENLKLDEVKAGSYSVNCLPLKVLAEAAPIRCILLA